MNKYGTAHYIVVDPAIILKRRRLGFGFVQNLIEPPSVCRACLVPFRVHVLHSRENVAVSPPGVRQRFDGKLFAGTACGSARTG